MWNVLFSFARAAKPFSLRHCVERRINTKRVITIVTAVAKQKQLVLVTQAAQDAFFVLVRILRQAEVRLARITLQKGLYLLLPASDFKETRRRRRKRRKSSGRRRSGRDRGKRNRKHGYFWR